MSLLSVEGLRIETSAGKALLEDLSFTMAPGEFLGVVGESGSGKTMAARAILGLLAPGVRRAGGAIHFGGRDLARSSAAELLAVRGSRIGMVFQEPMVSLNPAMTIGRQMAEGLKLHRRLSSDAIRTLSLDMLARVQIADPARCLGSYPHEFSGGMRQRIMLASAMALKPELLIADEPTTALDTLNQREVLDLMAALARDEGAAVLLITHDLGLVARYCQRVVVLEKGRLMEAGASAEVLTRPRHPYTRRLLDSLPRRRERPRTLRADAPVLLSVEGASIAYAGRMGLMSAGASRPVVREVDLSVREGEFVALVGASGSGKTSLGRAIVGLKELSGGAIRFDGTDIARMTRDQRMAFRRAVQFIFQDPFSSLDPRLRVGESVVAALRHVKGLSVAERRARVGDCLAEVGLDGFADRYPHQMSGGQRQRIAIARAIVSRPRLVVADEPVSALDVTIQRQVLNLFQALQAQHGFACLFITHDLGVVEEVADRVVVMSQGAVVEAGDVSAVFAAPRHDYTRALIAATPSLAVLELPMR